jgi:glycosyltransferase involved in cell wall biosynthesis
MTQPVTVSDVTIPVGQSAGGGSASIAGILVSVIIPVYQGDSSILAAVGSALKQTHRNLDVIVIDDGSTDLTWTRLESIDDPRVRIFQQANLGASAARNLGLIEARGEYIAFLDADDLWMPNKLETELAIIQSKTDRVGIVYSWYYCVDDTGMLSRPSPAITYSGIVFDKLLTTSLFIIPSASLFHRRVFEYVGMFDTTRRYHEDLAFVLRACRRFPAYPSMRYGAIYMQSMNGKARRVMRDYEAAVRASLSIVTDIGDILSIDEAARLNEMLRRELYFRFLMYGFSTSARKLLQDIPVPSLLGGLKGWLGWFFALTNINLMQPTRYLIQGTLRTIGRRRWRRFLQSSGIDVQFVLRAPNGS